MPPFNPGEEVVAIATFPTKPAGLPCTAELWLASDMTKVATSGKIPFTATGGDKSITLPIALPGDGGTYPVLLDVFSDGVRIARFLGDEDVVIAVPIAKFYMPARFTKSEITSRWDMPPYYYAMEFECPITNNGDTEGTHTIIVNNNHPSDLTPWSFELTLGPGETYLWKHSQLAIWPMTFYLEGDWEEDNYSVGSAAYSGLATLYGSVFYYVPNWSTWIIPLAGVTVQLWTYDWSELLTTVFTGTGNVWNIENIYPGTYMLYWQKEGFTPVERQVVLVANTEQKHDIWMVDPLIYP